MVFWGAENWPVAVGKGLVTAVLGTADGLLASDPVEAARNSFVRELGAGTTASNPEVLKFADVLVLAVKPDQAAPLLNDVRKFFGERHLLISIAAGVPLAKMEEALPGGSRLIRVM